MMINFTQLPEWMDLKIWRDKLMLSGLEGTYSMVVDKEGYITDTGILADYVGNNLPKGTLWLPTSRFRTQFRQLWEDFSMESYVSNKVKNGEEVAFTTRRELSSILKSALEMVPSKGEPEDVWIGKEKTYDQTYTDDRTFDHPYLYHYMFHSNNHIRDLTDNIVISIYHIYDEKDDKVKIIFNVTGAAMSSGLRLSPSSDIRVPEWNPKVKVPLTVLFG